MKGNHQAAKLAPREVEVLTLAAIGKTNKQIAQCLHIREGTVEQHLDHIYKKWGLSNLDDSPRITAIRLALKYRIIEFNEI